MTRSLFLPVAILAVVAAQFGTVANREIVTDSEYRRAFASQHQNDGASFSTGGKQGDVLVVSVSMGCSEALDTIARDAAFVNDIAALGFTSLECLRYDDALHIVATERRDIVSAKSRSVWQRKEVV